MKIKLLFLALLISLSSLGQNNLKRLLMAQGSSFGYKLWYADFYNSITMPPLSGANIGDILVLVVSSPTGVYAVTPSGWSSTYSSNVLYPRIQIFTKIATSSDMSGLTIDLSETNYSYAVEYYIKTTSVDASPWRLVTDGTGTDYGSGILSGSVTNSNSVLIGVTNVDYPSNYLNMVGASWTTTWSTYAAMTFIHTLGVSVGTSPSVYFTWGSESEVDFSYVIYEIFTQD